MKWVIAALSWALVLHTAVTSASRLTPPVLPLIVRNPYLSTWLADARHDPWSKWPMFWAGENVGMSLMAHVPSTGNVYPLLGRPHDSLGQNKSENGYEQSLYSYSLFMLYSYCPRGMGLLLVLTGAVSNSFSAVTMCRTQLSAVLLLMHPLPIFLIALLLLRGPPLLLRD